MGVVGRVVVGICYFWWVFYFYWGVGERIRIFFFIFGVGWRVIVYGVRGIL